MLILYNFASTDAENKNMRKVICTPAVLSLVKTTIEHMISK